MRYKILNTIGSKYSLKAKSILNSLGDVDYLDLKQSDLEARIADYDILFMQLEVKVDQAILENAKKLKVITVATTGLDHIDTSLAKLKNIKILSLKEEKEFLSKVPGTAELAFGLMIDLMRFTISAFESVKKYQWNNERFRGHNLYKQTLGIVGLGRLGKLMARYANAFGMKVIAFDPYIDSEIFIENNCMSVSFDELLSESDVVSIHVHLNNETEDLFARNIFEKMKKTAYLVNTSRGNIVNESDVLKALKEGLIAGYATDVLSGEVDFKKEFSNNSLVEYSKNNDNLIIVPHIGGTTYESREATDIFMAEKLKRYLNSL